MADMMVVVFAKIVDTTRKASIATNVNQPFTDLCISIGTRLMFANLVNVTTSTRLEIAQKVLDVANVAKNLHHPTVIAAVSVITTIQTVNRVRASSMELWTVSVHPMTVNVLAMTTLEETIVCSALLATLTFPNANLAIVTPSDQTLFHAIRKLAIAPVR